ncbi:GTPase activating protein 1-like [Nymphaea colorata]|nr:GTPase activating protein 1-like [Nymphaea colorata]
MDDILGFLRVHVIRGVNLAVRDIRTSDPYVVVRMGDQKLKTKVMKKNVNPEWNEKLTLTISESIRPIRIEVYDKDRFSHDDGMGDAEIDINPFMEAVKMRIAGSEDNVVYRTILPAPNNCLATESCIRCVDGKIVQDIILRLRNVECGELELQLVWQPLQRARRR